MKKYKLDVQLLAITPEPEKLIEEAGRTCYLSLDSIKENSHESFIQAAVRRGHHSILEHATASFRVKGASRSLTHQLVRHRIASFSQQSQRYVNEAGFEYVTPPSISQHENVEADMIFEAAMVYIQDAYEKLRALNVPKEDARFVLPNACTSEIVVSANFREWRTIFGLRMDKHAQWEVRLMANYIYGILMEHAPNVFRDMAPLREYCPK